MFEESSKGDNAENVNARAFSLAIYDVNNDKEHLIRYTYNSKIRRHLSHF